MKVFSAAGLVLLILASWLHEPPFQIDPYFYGHVKRTSEGQTEVAPDAPSGLVMQSDWVILDHNTWVVPNCMKHGLGIELGIDNVPRGVEELHLVVDFPPMTLPNGETRSSVDRMQPIYPEGGYGYFDYYYFFDEEFERGTGEWRFRLYHEDRLLYDATFIVVDCEE
ncbi:MAG: DUF3859 domain-containing protein [Verrucomicrobiota bacterium]